MNTPSISTILPGAPANAVRTASSGQDNAANSPTATFSEVLTQQQPAHETKGPTAAAETQTAKPATQQADNAQAPDEDSDDTLALLAGEHGLTLAQMALSIAVQTLSLSDTKASLSDAAGKLDVTFATRLEAGVEHAARKPATQLDLAVDEPAAQNKTTPAVATASVAGITLSDLKQASPAPLLAHQTQTEPGKPTASSAKSEPRGLSALRSGQAAPDTDGMRPVNGQNNSPALVDAARSAPDARAGELPSATSGSAAGMLNQAVAQTAGQGLAQPLLQTGSSLAVNTPLQSPQWASDFGRQFVALTQTGGNATQSAELRLDPPELGPIRISININDNVAQAIFVSPHSSVRQSIENALPQLQDLLAQSGISLGQTSVSDHDQPQEAFDHSLASNRKSSGSANVAGPGLDGGDALAHTAARSKAPNALVDTFA